MAGAQVPPPSPLPRSSGSASAPSPMLLIETRNSGSGSFSFQPGVDGSIRKVHGKTLCAPIWIADFHTTTPSPRLIHPSQSRHGRFPTTVLSEIFANVTPDPGL